MSLQWCNDAKAHVGELTNEGNPSVDYVLFELQDPKSACPRMELFSMGKGGRAKVVELLLPETNKVVTGAFLASAIDERGSVVSVRRKFIHVIWVGTRVGIMVKGKVNTSLTQHFKNQFPGCAMYLQLSDGDVDDLQPDVLERTLLAAGGAHKPTRYSFTNRTLIGSLSLDDSSWGDNGGRRGGSEPDLIQAPTVTLKKTAQELEEEARRKAAEAEAKRKAAQEEEARQRAAEAEARRKAAEEEEARRKAAEEEVRRQAEEERLKKIMAQEAERKAREEEARRKAYEEEQEQKAKAAAMTPKAALSDKKLVMLISSMSGNMTTSTNQALAQSMLEGMEVVPEIVDGADPSQKDLRNELFDLSGMRGKYPQFFLKQANGNMKFFGDFDTLTHYNDTGTLAQQLAGCATPKNNNSQSANYNGGARAAPSVVSTLNGGKLLLLISSMSGSLEVSSNQSRVEGILRGLHLPKEEIEIIDGSDPAVKDRRNELFGISGIRAKYPQLFLVKPDGTTHFVGNFDDVCYLHDTNTLSKAIGLNSKTVAPEPVSTLNGNKLLLLISSMSGSLEVSSNQTRVEGILRGLHLSKAEVEIMDGGDPSVKDRRNDLFNISGIRAKYPQLFLVNGADGTTHYVGNFDDVCHLHDTNTLAQSIGLVSKANRSSGSSGSDTGATVSAPIVDSTSPVVDNPKPEPTDTKPLPPSPSKEPVETQTPDSAISAEQEPVMPPVEASAEAMPSSEPLVEEDHEELEQQEAEIEEKIKEEDSLNETDAQQAAQNAGEPTEPQPSEEQTEAEAPAGGKEGELVQTLKEEKTKGDILPAEEKQLKTEEPVADRKAPEEERAAAQMAEPNKPSAENEGVQSDDNLTPAAPTEDTVETSGDDSAKISNDVVQAEVQSEKPKGSLEASDSGSTESADKAEETTYQEENYVAASASGEYEASAEVPASETEPESPIDETGGLIIQTEDVEGLVESYGGAGEGDTPLDDQLTQGEKEAEATGHEDATDEAPIVAEDK